MTPGVGKETQAAKSMSGSGVSVKQSDVHSGSEHSCFFGESTCLPVSCTQSPSWGRSKPEVTCPHMQENVSALCSLLALQVTKHIQLVTGQNNLSGAEQMTR